MLAIGVIASILGIAAGLLIDWFPVQASGQAKPIDTLWDVLLIASIPVFVMVQVIVLFSVWKFRMRPGEELLDGPPIHGNTRLEVVWTAIPAILLVGLCTYAFVVLEDIERAEADSETLNVRVVGEQFAWTFYYDRDGEEVASRQLHLPVDRPVKFTLQSKDVLHDFWVPAFRMKKDAVPGIDVTYRVTPNRIGSYPIVCAELCGLGHSVMRARRSWSPRRTTRRGSRASASPRADDRRRRRRWRRRGDGRQGDLHRPGGRLRLLPHARRRGLDRADRPEPRRDARRQGRGLHPRSRSSTRTRRSPTAPSPTSCRGTTRRRCRRPSSTRWFSTFRK